MKSICSSFTRTLILLPLIAQCAISIGCDFDNATPLAIIDRVGPSIVEPGDTIRIEGQGFVEGPVAIVLKGEFSRQGVIESETRTIRLDGTAVSGTMIEIPVTGVAMKKLADEPTLFKGSVEADFPSAPTISSVHVFARIAQVSFDLSPAGFGVELAAKKARKGAEFLASIGLSSAGSGGEDSLLIANVAKNSPAGNSGAEPGDRLLSVDGTAVASLSDLARLDGAGRHRFEFLTRSGSLKEASLSAGSGTVLDPDEFTALLLSSIALGIFLAFAAPTTGLMTRQRFGTKDPLARILGFATVSVFFLLIPALSLLNKAGFGTSMVLAGLNTLGLAVIHLFFRKAKPLNRVIGLFANMLPVPTMMAVAAVSGSSIGFTDIVASQQDSSWGWHVWSSPFAMAAVFASLALFWPGRAADLPSSRISQAVVWAAAIPAAVLVTTCCLGGWIVPGVALSRIPESGWFMALGCLIFLAKAWAVLLVARWFASIGFLERRVKTARDRDVGLRISTLIGAIALALLWTWADVPASFRVTGQILATAASVTFFTLLFIVGFKKSTQPAGALGVERN